MSAAQQAAATTAGAGLPAAYATDGRTMDASTDPAETYFVAQTVAMNTANAGGTATGVRIENTPQAVATPFPPRNRSHTGYTWPTTAAMPASAGAVWSAPNR